MMNFLTTPISVSPFYLIGAGLLIVGLSFASLWFMETARTWENLTRLIGGRAYEKGREDERELQARPIDERISDAYQKGLRDCHTEWVAATKRNFIQKEGEPE